MLYASIQIDAVTVKETRLTKQYMLIHNLLVLPTAFTELSQHVLAGTDVRRSDSNNTGVDPWIVVLHAHISIFWQCGTGSEMLWPQ